MGTRSFDFVHFLGTRREFRSFLSGQPLGLGPECRKPHELDPDVFYRVREIVAGIFVLRKL